MTAPTARDWPGGAWSCLPIPCSSDGERQDQDARASPGAYGIAQPARHVGAGTPQKNGCALLLVASP